MTAIDPARSTVVVWYDELPDALASLVARVHAAGTGFLGDAYVPRDPAQIHGTVIGLERTAAPFDPRPLAAHLHAALDPPLTIRFGGFARADRRMLSQGRPLHDRTFSAWEWGDEVGALRRTRVVIRAWPVVDDNPCLAVADLRDSCAPLGVTHRYGTDPDVYLVIADLTATADACTALETAVRAELAGVPVTVPMSATDLCLVTYDDPALPRASSTWRPLPAG